MKHGLAATEIVQPCSAVDKGQWKQFVRSRVNEILGATRKDRWRHCPGEINPADIGSRG